MIFDSVLEHFATRMHGKRWEISAFSYTNLLFRGTEVPTNVFARTHPIASIRPKMIIECFGAFRYANACKMTRKWCVSVLKYTVSGKRSFYERFRKKTPNRLYHSKKLFR